MFAFIVLLFFFSNYTDMLCEEFHLRFHVGYRNERQERVPLIGATVKAIEQRKGAVTDKNGFAHLMIHSKDSTTVVISSVGYLSDTVIVEPHLNRYWVKG
mgnify:FL=1